MHILGETELPYTTDGGNLVLEITIDANNIAGTAQVIVRDPLSSFGIYQLEPIELARRSSGGSCVLAGAPAIQRPGRPNRRICGILCREKGNLQKGFPFLFYTFKAVEEYRMDFRKRDRVVEGCNWLMVGVAAGWVAYTLAGSLFSPADSATGFIPISDCAAGFPYLQKWHPSPFGEVKATALTRQTQP